MGSTSIGQQGESSRWTWRRLKAEDVPLLAGWLADPEVERWWCHDSSPAGVARDFGPSVRGDEPGEDLIALCDGDPVGFVQRSRLGDYPSEQAGLAAIVEVPDEAVQLDYLIGAPEQRGRGVGSGMIAAAVADTWATYPAAPAVMVAVVAANVASWRALENAGLHRVGQGALRPENPIDDPLHYVYRVDRPPQRVADTLRRT